MKTVLGAALEVHQFLSRVGERFCFIGGLALQRWGEDRFVRKLLELFEGRVDNAAEFAYATFGAGK